MLYVIIKKLVKIHYNVNNNILTSKLIIIIIIIIIYLLQLGCDPVAVVILHANKT